MEPCVVGLSVSPLFGGLPKLYRRPDDGYIKAFPDGFAADNRFFVVDPHTRRAIDVSTCQALSRLSLTYERADNNLCIKGASGEIVTRFTMDEPIEIAALDGFIRARPVSPLASAWLANRLGREVILVFREGIREMSRIPEGADPQHVTGNLPYTLISQVSLAEMSRRTGVSLDWSHLPQSIVIGGDISPFAEDRCKEIHIEGPSGPRFKLVQPLEWRCPDENLLNGQSQALNRYLVTNRVRRTISANGSERTIIAFGYRLKLISTGVVEVGNPVKLLE